MNHKVLKRLGFVLSLLLLFYILKPSNQVKFVIHDIQKEFRGLIIDKYTVREGVYSTFLKVNINEGKEYIDINPSFKILHYSDVGDSIIKLKDENICYVLKKNGVKKKFSYVSISQSQRNDKNFPEQWKDKWMESTILLDSVYGRN